MAAFNQDLAKEQFEALMAQVNKHGVCSLPPDLRDDILMISTFDREGIYNMTRFLVTVRKRGLNFLGPRMDQDASEPARRKAACGICSRKRHDPAMRLLHPLLPPDAGQEISKPGGTRCQHHATRAAQSTPSVRYPAGCGIAVG